MKNSQFKCLAFLICCLLIANCTTSPCSGEFLTQDQAGQEDSTQQQSADETKDPKQSNSQTEKDQKKNAEVAQDEADDDGQQEQAEPDERPSRAQRRGRPPRNRDPSRDSSKRSSEIESLLKPLVASAEASMVKVMSGDRIVSLGTVVDRDGLILTKASELKADLTCEFPDGRLLPATVFGIDDSTDLAILKVHADNLLPVHWGPGDVPTLGQWVVAPTLDQQYQIQVGVVAVDARKIPPSSPYLGIMGPTAPQEGVVGAQIDTVQPNTPAEEANLMVGDFIIGIDEVEIKNWDDLRRTLGQYDPKDEIELTIQRGKEELKIRVTLGDRERLEARAMNVPQLDRSNLQNRMGSRPSQRRKDFPLAIQTDLMLDRTTCGGPLVNLDGQIVGINIARAGRVDSFALPVNVVLPVVEKLKTGEFAPEIINQARLEKIQSELEEISQQRVELPGRKDKLENRTRIEKARLEEIERNKQEIARAIEELERSKKELAKGMQDLEKRIKVIEEKSEMYQKEIDSIVNKQRQFDRRQQSLEREQERLKLGVN